jgi:hypothetical protein
VAVSVAVSVSVSVSVAGTANGVSVSVSVSVSGTAHLRSAHRRPAYSTGTMLSSATEANFCPVTSLSATKRR